MHHKLAFIPVLTAAVCLAGCGDSATASQGPFRPGDAGDVGDAGIDVSVIPGVVSLAVQSAREDEVGPTPPDAGQTHIVLDVAIANGQDSSRLVGAAVFWASGADGLERGASPLTDLLPTGCPSNALLSPGASTQCQLAFVVPTTLTLNKLIYRDGQTSAETAIPVIAPCDRCEGHCVDLASDPQHCGECGHAVPPDATCTKGEVECTTAGSIRCANGTGDVSCVVPDSAEHCGSCDPCDAISPDNLGECRQGSCLYPAGGFMGNCTFICSQFGMTCAFSTQCGADGDCQTAQAQGCALTCYCRE